MAETLVSRDAGTEPRRARRGIIDLSPVVAAGLAAAGAIEVLLYTSTPVLAILRYGAYLLLGVLLPGTLVHRALRGRSPLLIADLALGAATGLALELLAWASFTAAHLQRYLWVWPLLVVVPMLAIPASRRELGRTSGARRGRAERSPAAAWVLAAAFGFVSATAGLLSMVGTPLPPRPNAYSQDLYWQLSIAAELTRHVPPQVPQVAGRTLHYHWFANAHLAASSLISGVDLPVVLLRLWLLPVLAVVLGLMVAVSRRVSGQAWPGAVAGLLTVAPAMLTPWHWYDPVITSAITPTSPSQIFGLVFLLLAADVLVDLVRGERVGRGWVVLVLAVAGASGSKSSVLPVLLGGLVCALAANAARRQRGRRHGIGQTAGAVALVAVVLAASSRVVAGGEGGSTVRFLSLLAFVSPWRRYAPTDTIAGTGGLAVPGLHRGTALGAAVITATLLLQYVWAMTGMALLRRDTRGDPAAWLLAGGLVSGLSAMLLIDHPSAGQLYFARTALPLGAVLAGWGLAAAVRAAAGPVDPAGAAARWRIVALLAVGASAGIGAVLLGARWGSGPSSAADIPAALSAPLLVLGVALAVGCAGWLVLARISRFGLAGGGSAVLAAAVLAGCLTYGPHNSLRSVRAALTGPTRPLGPHAVSAGETEAALWLRQHAGEEDVVATNVHCIDFRTRPYCDSRAFWVSALSERLVLVEGWGYTDEAQAAHGRNGRSYHNQPFDDPALLALNDGAFTDPTPAALARLRDRHGVRWLFADRRAGPVSPLLARYAQLRHTSGDGSVFQLRPAG